MKIDAIKATPVNIELEAPYFWVQGTLPGFTQVIVEIQTDQGITAIGEAAGAISAEIINNVMGPRLIGKNPLDIMSLERLCLPSWRGVNSGNDYLAIRAFGGLEMALWDFRGKLWNQPLYQLFGGAIRREIPFTDYFSYRQEKKGKGGEDSPEAVADYCVKLNEKFGSTYFEGKFSTPDPKLALGAVRMIRKRLGDEVMIRIDSNKAYSLPTAIQLAPSLEELGVRNWEDPVGTFEEMARLRRHTSIPFSTHNIDLSRAVNLRAPDAFVTDVSTHGGFSRLLRFIGACEAMGLDFWPYSGDSGVGMAAYLHVCAATEWIREPGQSLLHWQAGDIIEGGPMQLKNNMIPVPEGPGLGVTIDSGLLERHHRLFLENGPMNKFYDPQAPGVFRRLPLN